MIIEAYGIMNEVTGSIYLPHSMVFWRERKNAEDSLRLCWATAMKRKDHKVVKALIQIVEEEKCDGQEKMESQLDSKSS